MNAREQGDHLEGCASPAEDIAEFVEFARHRIEREACILAKGAGLPEAMRSVRLARRCAAAGSARRISAVASSASPPPSHTRGPCRGKETNNRIHLHAFRHDAVGANRKFVLGGLLTLTTADDMMSACLVEALRWRPRVGLDSRYATKRATALAPKHRSRSPTQSHSSRSEVAMPKPLSQPITETRGFRNGSE